jgi:hypothetical protein
VPGGFAGSRDAARVDHHSRALSRHIGRLFCRAAAPTRRGGASQKESLGPRAEFRRLSMPTIAGANFRVGRQPTGAATSVNTGRLLAAKHLSGDLHFRIDQPDRTLRRTLHTSPRRIPFESSHCGIRRSNNRVSGPTLATGDACVTENVAQRWVRWNAFLYHSYNFSKTAPSTAPLSLTSPASRVAA